MESDPCSAYAGLASQESTPEVRIVFPSNFECGSCTAKSSCSNILKTFFFHKRNVEKLQKSENRNFVLEFDLASDGKKIKN